MNKQTLELSPGFYWVMFRGNWIVAEYFERGTHDKSPGNWKIDGDIYSNHDVACISFERIESPGMIKAYRRNIDELEDHIIRLTKEKIALDKIINQVAIRISLSMVIGLVVGLIIGYILHS